MSTTGAAFDGGVATTATGGCVVNAALAGDGHVNFASNEPHVRVVRGRRRRRRDGQARLPADLPGPGDSTVTRDTSAPCLVQLHGPQRRRDDLLDHRTEPAGRQPGRDRPGGRARLLQPVRRLRGRRQLQVSRALASPQSSNIATATLKVVAPAAGTPQRAEPDDGIDADKDGFFAGQDCNDNNAAIRPGAVEVKGNRLDENCDGLAEPFPTLDVRRGEQVGRQGLAA